MIELIIAVQRSKDGKEVREMGSEREAVGGNVFGFLAAVLRRVEGTDDGREAMKGEAIKKVQ
jgi:hypothetical protein